MYTHTSFYNDFFPSHLPSSHPSPFTNWTKIGDTEMKHVSVKLFLTIRNYVLSQFYNTSVTFVVAS